MYKKKELIAMLEACRKYPQIETSQLEDKLRSAIKTKRRPRLNSKNKNALMDIYNAGVEDPAKKAIEEIFNIIRFDEAYKEIGICSEDDFWEAVYENSKELKSDTYGFYSNRAAFEKDGIPANVFLMECRGKYIVYTGDEFDGSECCSLGLQFIEYGLFETYEAADEYYKTLINAGIPSGKEQIKKCKEDLTESEDIYIKSRSGIYDNVDFNVYYKNILIIEHMDGLELKKINKAVQDFNDYCKRNNLMIEDIQKYRPWTSNQRYYVVHIIKGIEEYEIWYVHIRSDLQGRERNVVDLITPSNIVSEMS